MKYCCDNFEKARAGSWPVVELYDGLYVHALTVISLCPWCRSVLHPEEEEDCEASKSAAGAEA